MVLLKAPETYDSRLRTLLSKGWEMKSEGASGAQLQGKKKMKALDQLALIFGVLLVFIAPPFGAFIIICALVDYFFLTSGKKGFLHKDGTFVEN